MALLQQTRLPCSSMRSQRSILPLNAARRSIRAAVAAPLSGPAGTSSAPVRKDERGFVLNEVSYSSTLTTGLNVASTGA
jgi:hypothetical protein